MIKIFLKKLRIKQKAFKNLWITKGLQKTSKKKQRIYEKYMKKLIKQTKEVNCKSTFKAKQKKSKKFSKIEKLSNNSEKRQKL